ncbi:MAG: hypothetical protein ACOC8E_09005, partial [Planctomycetota bacterium]
MWRVGVGAALLHVLSLAAASAATVQIECPRRAVVFERCEVRLTLPGLDLPDTQVHDAYDADRDGRFARVSATFTLGDRRVTVPGFAMREKPGGRWAWRIRWAPYRPGRWTGELQVKARLGPKAKQVNLGVPFPHPIEAAADARIAGPLIVATGEQNPRCLRVLNPDGSSRATWLFGACRAWVVRSQDKHNDWSPHEWLDRETELFAPMRDGGFNLLNQWMAPWEFLLVHHDRAEFWRTGKGVWKRRPIPKTAAWSSYQCFDQGRAAAFDKLVEQCEGGPGVPLIRMLLSPLPHQCVQVKEHPWGSQESGWSPENDAGKQSLERLNGFSGFRRKMSVWAFFEADPSRPLDDPRSQLFDHQANFFRYLIARWGYSRAVGVWVLVDELDAVGNVVGVMKEKTGWWGHPGCGQWLANVVRMFRGRLKRSDGLAYGGDPFRHPLHVATTSFGGGAGRGGNIDWSGGPKDARPDVFGWHWYPGFRGARTWHRAWSHAVTGVGSYARAPIGPVPRLISEFGAPDRDTPEDTPSRLYPTLYHHAIWAAIFSGQAGTPMDWDDGKQFGELRWRRRKGLFDKESYPINHVARMKALRRFLGGLDPGRLVSCSAKAAAVEIEPSKFTLAFALYRRTTRDAAYGWLLSTGGGARLTLTGLAGGTYRLTWYDPWTGSPVEKLPGRRNVKVEKKKGLEFDAGPALKRLAAKAKT